MANEYGRTHPRRDPTTNCANAYSNDGRAPDTMSKLVGKKPLEKQRKQAVVTLNETFGAIYFVWKENSCWLDVSLVLIDNAVSRRWDEFRTVCGPVLGEEGIGGVLGSIQ
jgi:hypothetical protein